MELKHDAWPPPLAHCGLPLLSATDQYVVVGEVTSERVNGFKGNRLLYTALVPQESVVTVLGATGGLISDIRKDPKKYLNVRVSIF